MSVEEDASPSPHHRKRARSVQAASALLLCFGAAVIYGDINGISVAPLGSGGSTRATSARVGERKNDYRRLVDSDSAKSYDSTQQLSDLNGPSTMPVPSVSDVVVTEDGTVTMYDLWFPLDHNDGTGVQSSPCPLVVMQTRPNNWMFGHDMACCEMIRSYLDQGIAVASVVISTSTDLGTHQSMAVELIKSRAGQYDIDPDRITLHAQDDATAQINRRILEQGHDKKLENIVERTMMHWAAVPPTYENVPYIGKGSGGERTMDFWRAEPVDENDTGRRPVVLYVHGGGWLAGTFCIHAHAVLRLCMQSMYLCI